MTGAFSGAQYQLHRNRTPLLVLSLLIGVTLITHQFTPFPLSYFDISSNLGTGGGLALASMGLALVVLTRGIDLSVGAIVSLVSVFVGSTMTDSPVNQIVVSVLGLLIGTGCGAVNGFLVAYLRIQPIVVTLATLFILQGAALLVMPIPGGYVTNEFINFFAGDAIPNLLPAALVVILSAIALWMLLRNSRLGMAIYAIGSDEAAAAANGVKTAKVKFLAYTIAGGFYGASGLFITAQAGGSDPLVGSSMLIQVFTAVVLGGTSLAGGRGGLVGPVFGAFLLMSTVNTLMVFSMPTYLSPIFDGAILILAVVLSSLMSENSLLHNLSDIVRQVRGSLAATRPRAHRPMAETIPDGAMPHASFRVLHAENIRQVLPALGAFLVIVAVTFAFFGNLGADYVRSLLLLTALLGVLGFGQATVIITGGLDLSIPWAITLCAVVFSSLVDGSDAALLWSVPAVIGLGLTVGLVNGLGVIILGLPPLVMTLAVNGILQGLTLFYTNGSPKGFSPPLLLWFVSGNVLGLQPVVWAFIPFVILATIFLTATAAGRQLYALGNSAVVANLSGINVRLTTVLAYMICGASTALAAVLLVGFNGASTLSMGDQYLLPSVAVVVAGGVLITGGRGHYPGVVCGVLMLIALQILIGGTMLPDAFRSIILGCVLMAALLALREGRVSS